VSFMDSPSRGIGLGSIVKTQDYSQLRGVSAPRKWTRAKSSSKQGHPFGVVAYLKLDGV